MKNTTTLSRQPTQPEGLAGCFWASAEAAAAGTAARLAAGLPEFLAGTTSGSSSLIHAGLPVAGPASSSASRSKAGGADRGGGIGLLLIGASASALTTNVAPHFEHFIFLPTDDVGTFSLLSQLLQETIIMLGVGGDGEFDGTSAGASAADALNTLPHGHFTDLPSDASATFSFFWHCGQVTSVAISGPWFEVAGSRGQATASTISGSAGARGRM